MFKHNSFILNKDVYKLKRQQPTLKYYNLKISTIALT